MAAPTTAAGPATRNSDKRKKSLPAKKNATATKEESFCQESYHPPVPDMSDIIADEIRKECGIPDAMDKMEEVARKQGEAGGDVLSQNYLLTVLNKLQLQGPPSPPAPTTVPPPPGVDAVTIIAAEKPAPVQVPEKPAPTPTRPIAEKLQPAPLFAPIPVWTPPEEEEQQEENNAEDEASTKENLKFLTENPGMKDMILKIEDMLLDFRSTNQKATQDDNIQFQQGMNALIDVYSVSKTKDMYKRNQENFLAFAPENNINIDKMVDKKSKLTFDNFITKCFVTQGMVYCPSSLYVI